MSNFIITYLPYIISIILAGSATGGLIYNGLQSRAAARSYYFSTLEKLYKEIKDELDDSASSRRCCDYNLFGVYYLNELDKIANLANNKIIDNSIAKFFKDYFSQGSALLDDLDFKQYLKEEKISAEEGFDNFFTWCDTNKIRPTHIPDKCKGPCEEVK